MKRRGIRPDGDDLEFKSYNKEEKPVLYNNGADFRVFGYQAFVSDHEKPVSVVYPLRDDSSDPREILEGIVPENFNLSQYIIEHTGIDSNICVNGDILSFFGR